MLLTPNDEALIAFYFRADRLFGRSTFGATLERADAASRTSEGARVPPTPSWAYRPEGEGLMHVTSAHEPSAGYELDDEDLMRHAKASKRMRQVIQAEPRAYATLEAYYGDRGARWAAFSAERREDRSGVIIVPAVGPGAIAAVYALTESGQRLLAHERALSARVRGGDKDKPAKKNTTVDQAAIERTTALDAAVAARKDGLRTALDKLEQSLVALSKAVEVLSELRARAVEPANREAHRKDLRAARATRDNAKLEVKAATLRHEAADAALAMVGRARGWTPVPATTPGPIRSESHLTDDELLQVVMLLQKERPDAQRRRRLDQIRDEAEGLIVRAWQRWMATGSATRRPRAEPHHGVLTSRHAIDGHGVGQREEAEA